MFTVICVIFFDVEEVKNIVNFDLFAISYLTAQVMKFNCEFLLQ